MGEKEVNKKLRQSLLAVTCAYEAWCLWEDGKMPWDSMLRVLRLASLQKPQLMLDEFDVENHTLRLFLAGQLDLDDVEDVVRYHQEQRNLLKDIDLKQPRRMYRAK